VLHFNAARRGYYQLIQRFPQSPLVPYAYLAFGELFVHESQTDPSKLALAEQALLKVLSYPDKTPARRAALDRLAQVFHAMGDATKAASVEDQIAREFPSRK